MASDSRFPLRFLKPALAPAALLLAVLASDSNAQWAGSKQVGISGTTVWGADKAKSIHRVRFDPVGNALTIDQAGPFKYRLADLLGAPLASGEGTGHAVCDLSRVPQGMYFLILQGMGGPRIHFIRKMAP